MAAKKSVLSLESGKVGFKRSIQKPVVKKRSPRVATGIPGFDIVSEGGLERDSTNLVVGNAGSGKTIFGMQYLVKGIKFGENGVYLTFEENRKRLYAHMKKFNWDLEDLEKKGKFAVIEFIPEQVEQFILEGGGMIESTITKINAKRVVIDSLTAFSLLYSNDLERKKACLTLFKMLQNWGCTSILIAESESNANKLVTSLMEFETDSVIHLYNARNEDHRERSLEILKMRGTHHSSSTFPMKITPKGMTIYPEDAVF